MKKQFIGVAGALGLLVVAGGVHAGQGCSSITDYSSTWAVSGSNDAPGAEEIKMPWRMSLDYSYNNANELIMGSERRTDLEPAYRPGIGVRNRYEKTVLGVSYDFSSRLMAGVSIPVVRNERWEDHHHFSDYTSKGLGDITAYGRYWLKQEKDAFNYYVEGAMGFPTGKSNAQFSAWLDTTTVGSALSTQPQAGYIQAGLGQWVPTLATGFETKLMETTSFFGRAQYSDPLGRNSTGYRSQSTLMTNIGASRSFALAGKSSYGVSGQFNWLFARFRRDTKTALTFNTSGAVATTTYAATATNTGGTWLDFQPGAFYSPDGSLMFTASMPINLNYHVNSLQTFAPWSLNLGVSQRF